MDAFRTLQHFYGSRSDCESHSVKSTFACSLCVTSVATTSSSTIDTIVLLSFSHILLRVDSIVSGSVAMHHSNTQGVEVVGIL